LTVYFLAANRSALRPVAPALFWRACALFLAVLLAVGLAAGPAALPALAASTPGLALAPAPALAPTTALPAAPPSAACDVLWYTTYSASGPAQPGKYGYVTPGGTFTPVGTLLSNSTSMGISPLNPNTAYYVGFSTAGTGSGMLYRLDITTGASIQLNTVPNPMFITNRMGVAPDGALWTMTATGHLWSTVPGATGIGTPVDHGVPANGAAAQVSRGDLAFDGLGNMWLVAADSKLFTISAEHLGAPNPPATLVGQLGGGNFSGLAFGSGGRLYAATSEGNGQLAEVNMANGALTTVATGGSYVGDLASCALPRPDLERAKTVSPQGSVLPGAVLNYSVTTKNSGNLPATGSTAQDSLPANTSYVPGSTTLNGVPVPDIAGGSPYQVVNEIHSSGAFAGVVDAGATATLNYQLRVNDPFPAQAATVSNTAVIGAVGIPELPTAAVVTPVTALAPALELAKTVAEPALTVPGQILHYSFAVKNSGNVALARVTVTETGFTGSGDGPAINCPAAAASLAPGASLSCTASYQVSAADIVAGKVSNTATATGYRANGVPVVSAPSTATVLGGHIPSPDAPGLSFGMAADTSALQNPVKAGDAITYRFSIENTGNVALTGVAATGSLPGLSALSYAWPGKAGVLLPGQRAGATATYILGQADIEAGRVANSAMASGRAPSGPPVATPPTVAETPLAAAAGLDLVKTADVSGLHDPVALGDVLMYHFAATNTGNVALKGVVIQDAMPRLAALRYSWPGTPGELLPGQTVTAMAAYVITMADVATGSVSNSALAKGTRAAGGSGPGSLPGATPDGQAAAKSPSSVVTFPSAPAGSGGGSAEVGVEGSGAAALAETGADSFPAPLGALLACAGLGLFLVARRRSRKENNFWTN
jgi:uncharacterized repeat protein (TIGR01451 family)